MRIYPLLFLAFLAPAAVFAQKAPAPGPASHVLVVSVDGFGASELRGKPSCLPEKSTIRSLAEAGAWSHGARGILPTITYPTHATLATGTSPLKHGLIDNSAGGQWYSKRSDIRGETLWDAARKAGRSVAIVTWPSTYGADADWLIPEDLSNAVVATEQIRRGSTPELFDALAKATRAPQLLPFSSAEAGTPLDEMTARFAAEVVRRHKPHLLLAHFLDYDHRMHADPWSPEACKALERSDAWIAHILDAYRAAGILERTTVFVVSDHGFLEVKQRVNVFGLLQQAGWREVFGEQEVVPAFQLRVAAGSVAFYPGMVGADAARKIASRLRPAVEKRFGEQVRWITPDKARSLGGFPGALFVLCARPGYSLTAQPSADVLLERGRYHGAHGYCPDEPAMDAMFIASGYGVRRAGALPRMGVVDVGPTIAAFVGAKLPAATGRDVSRGFRVKKRAAPSQAR